VVWLAEQVPELAHRLKQRLQKQAAIHACATVDCPAAYVRLRHAAPLRFKTHAFCPSRFLQVLKSSRDQ